MQIFKTLDHPIILVDKISQAYKTSMDRKGCITIPAKIRIKEGFREGQQFSFLKTEEGYILIPLLTEAQLQEDLISSNLLIKSMKEAHISDIELER